MSHRETEHTKKNGALAPRRSRTGIDADMHVVSSMPCATVVESLEEVAATNASDSVNVAMKSLGNNAGADARAVVVGCNANNDNASARTVNGNNAVSNGNDNYAGRFSLPQNKDFNIGKTCTACSARTNNTEKEADQSYQELIALLQCEYSEDDIFASESNAYLPPLGASDPIWAELKKAQSKRHLKGLKKFLVHPTIVTAAVERCLAKAAPSPQRDKAIIEKQNYIKSIIKDMEDETYFVHAITSRTIKKRGKGDKDRHADIFSIYDRCVQNLLLIVIGPKIRNKLTRNVYSGIEGRSTTSKDRRFCMIDRVHDYCVKHPDDFVMMTDIYHFYESLRSEIVLGIVFETVYDRYTRVLLERILLSLPTLPIGGTLSQCFAMLVVNDCDRYIIQHFKPTIYCIFGDNRMFGDKDKKKLIKIREYQNIWYHARLGLEMKKDYSLHRVRDGFRLCKTYYDDKYVKIRAELRRRAIRGAIRGQQHYAGYKGFLMKTDSRRLRYLIEEGLPLLRRHIRPQSCGFTEEDKQQIKKFMAEKTKNNEHNSKLFGEKFQLNTFLNNSICITDYERKVSIKETGNDHYFAFQLIIPTMNENNEMENTAYQSWNGSADIIYFFERVERGEIELPVYTVVRKEGNSLYFEGYRDYIKDRTASVIDKFDIKFDQANVKPFVPPKLRK